MNGYTVIDSVSHGDARPSSCGAPAQPDRDERQEDISGTVTNTKTLEQFSGVFAPATPRGCEPREVDFRASRLDILAADVCADTGNRTPISSLARTRSTTKPYPRVRLIIQKMSHSAIFYCISAASGYDRRTPADKQAPVVKRISRQSSELLFQVRILAGAQSILYNHERLHLICSTKLRAWLSGIIRPCQG